MLQIAPVRVRILLGPSLPLFLSNNDALQSVSGGASAAWGDQPHMAVAYNP